MIYQFVGVVCLGCSRSKLTRGIGKGSPEEGLESRIREMGPTGASASGETPDRGVRGGTSGGDLQ
jgi:hypothetical protein